MAVFDLITLAELKRVVPLTGTGQDEFVREAITRASREVEQYLDRRLVYRAPGEDEQNDNIVASATWADGALTIASQPGAGGRTLIVTWSAATAGTVTVTGTVAGVAGTTEVFDAATGLVQHGTKFFTAISSVAGAGAAGGGTVKLGSSQGYVEYHSPACSASLLYPLEWPLRQVAEVNEDVARSFSAATALTTAQYQVRREARALGRLLGTLDQAWLSGYRVVRFTYSAGFFGTANVPQDVKRVACALAAWSLKEALKSQHGQASGSDAAGNFALLGPAMLSSGMKVALDPYTRPERFYRTGERDWDTEAA